MASGSNPVARFFFYATGAVVLYCIGGMLVVSPLGGLIIGPLLFLVWVGFWRVVAFSQTTNSLDLERAAAGVRARQSAPAARSRIISQPHQVSSPDPEDSEERQTDQDLRQEAQDFADLNRLF